MKKRILAILLVAATLATMVVIPAYAADVSAADYNNTPSTCPCCGKAWSNITWTDMPTGTTDSSTWAAADKSHYRLVGNLTLGSGVTCGFGVGSDANGTANKWTATFDLNGYTMTHTGTAGKERVLFETRSGCTLHIVDTSANSTGKAITSAPNGLWNRNDLGKAANKAYMKVYGGTFALSKNVASQNNNGGLIRNETSCELTLNGGVFDASEYDQDKKNGGTIYSNGPIITSNACIIGGGVKNGGAIYCDKAVEITNNTYIKGGTAEERGSAIYASSSLTLNGSVIEGSVYNNGGNIYVEGVLKVTELDLTAGTTAISTNKSTHAWSKLKAGSKIAVKAALDTAFGTGFTNADQAKQYAAYFASAVSGAAVSVNANNELVLCNIGVYGVDKNGNKTGYATVADAQADGNTVYLEVAGLNEITLSGDAIVDLKGNDVTINGNGKKVTLFDSANADYETYGQVTLVNATLENTKSYPAPDGKTYYTVLDNGQYSFHLLDAKLSSVGLKKSTGGLYYYATFMCDDLMAKNVQYFGIKYDLYDLNNEYVGTQYGRVNGKLLTEEGTAGNKVEIALGSMNNIVSGKVTDYTADECGKMKIKATPFACVYGEQTSGVPDLENDVVAFGTEQFKSLYEIFAGVNALCENGAYAALSAQMYQLLFVDWARYELDAWRSEFTNFAPAA